MYERFSDRARKVMQLANQNAQMLNHEYIGTEHILAGLVKEGSGIGATVLNHLGVSLVAIDDALKKSVEPGPDMVLPGRLPTTPRARNVIESAIEEARKLNHNYVGTEHLLLGLLSVTEGVAAQVLMGLGVTIEKAREEIGEKKGKDVAYFLVTAFHLDGESRRKATRRKYDNRIP